MRCYPQDSPQAAARIVILAMLADGHISLKELESLRGLGGEAQLGLDQGTIDCAVRILCEELLIYSEHSWTDAVKIDPLTRSNVLSEIDCLVLRQKILCAVRPLEDALAAALATRRAARQRRLRIAVWQPFGSVRHSAGLQRLAQSWPA